MNKQNLTEPQDPYIKPNLEFVDDPFPVFDELRNWSPIWKGNQSQSYLVTGFQQVNSFLRDPRFSSDINFGDTSYLHADSAELIQAQKYWMSFKNEPDHSQFRRPFLTELSANEIQKLKVALDANVCERLKEFEQNGEQEFVYGFTEPVLFECIEAWFGIPENSRDKFFWAVSQTASHLPPSPDRKIYPSYKAAKILEEIFSTLVESRTKKPGDDFVSNVIKASGETISNEIISANLMLVMFASYETILYFLPNAIYELLRNPNQLKLLSDDNTLIATATEELLRYCGSVISIPRVTTEVIETEFATIGKGERVSLILAAANRDPLEFENPAQLDILRTKNKHLALGGGAHYCIGAYFTRMFVQTIIKQVVDLSSRIRLPAIPPPYIRSVGLRGLQHLNLTIDS